MLVVGFYARAPRWTTENNKRSELKDQQFHEKIEVFLVNLRQKNLHPTLKNLSSLHNVFLRFFGTKKWTLHFLTVSEPAKLHKIPKNWES